MNSGKLNIDMEYVKKAIFEEGKNDQMVLTEMQEEQFRKAAEILTQNKKDCEQFKGRDWLSNSVNFMVRNLTKRILKLG